MGAKRLQKTVHTWWPVFGTRLSVKMCDQFRALLLHISARYQPYIIAGNRPPYIIYPKNILDMHEHIKVDMS